MTTKSQPRRKPRATPRKPASAKPAAKRNAATSLDPRLGAWGLIALLGAGGAGVAALVHLLAGKRDAPRRGADWPAHQVDGRNSSAQFDAQIADENMIPERVPEAIE